MNIKAHILFSLIMLSIQFPFYAQDEIIFRTGREVTCYDLKIDSISDDSIFITAFKKNKSYPVKDIIAYRKDYNSGTHYYYLNASDSIYLQKCELIKRNQLPGSFLNFGIGTGSNFGFMGTKTVIGKNGSGVMFGYGSNDGNIAVEIGGQYAHEFLYANIGYGVTIHENHSICTIDGMLGAMISIEKTKKTFIDFGIGYSMGIKNASATNIIHDNMIPKTMIKYQIGLCYRFTKTNNEKP